MNCTKMLFKHFGFYLTENTLCLLHRGQLLILFMGVIAVYCETRTGQLNTLCGKNAAIFNFKAGGAYSYRGYFNG
jgi:hypothetical protein